MSLYFSEMGENAEGLRSLFTSLPFKRELLYLCFWVIIEYYILPLYMSSIRSDWTGGGKGAKSAHVRENATAEFLTEVKRKNCII